MNLDLLPLGWVHFLASLVAIVTGAAVLVRPKGTAVHKARGRIYAAAIVVTGLTALGIYRVGGFFFAHWFGVAALIITAVGRHRCTLQDTSVRLDPFAFDLHGGELLHFNRRRRERNILTGEPFSTPRSKSQ
jgi:hypothetical protein